MDSLQRVMAKANCHRLSRILQLRMGHSTPGAYFKSVKFQKNITTANSATLKRFTAPEVLSLLLGCV